MSSQRTTIQETSSNESINIFGAILNVNSSYTISNAVAKHVHPNFKIAKHNFELLSVRKQKSNICNILSRPQPKKTIISFLQQRYQNTWTQTSDLVRMPQQQHLIQYYNISHIHNYFSSQTFHCRYHSNSTTCTTSTNRCEEKNRCYHICT